MLHLCKYNLRKDIYYIVLLCSDCGFIADFISIAVISCYIKSNRVILNPICKPYYCVCGASMSE